MRVWLITIWHKVIRKYLWDLPKSLISRQNMTISPQTFEQTEAFQVLQDRSIKAKFFSYYAKTITEIAALFPLYDYFEVGQKINNEILLLRLKHK